MSDKQGVNGGDLWEECRGRSLGDDPLTLKRCHSCKKQVKGGSPSVAESTT